MLANAGQPFVEEIDWFPDIEPSIISDAAPIASKARGIRMLRPA